MIDDPHLHGCTDGHLTIKPQVYHAYGCGKELQSGVNYDNHGDDCGLTAHHLPPEHFPEVYAAYRLAGMDAAEKVWAAAPTP